MPIGYYNTWTEEIYNGSEVDEDATSTEVATTEHSVSQISPGHGPSLDIGTSGGLDFISSRGYPEIEFGYSGESEDDAISDDDDDDDDDSTSLDEEGHHGKSPVKNNLVCLIFLFASMITRNNYIITHSIPYYVSTLPGVSY